MSFINLATVVAIWGGGGVCADLTPPEFSAIRGTISSKILFRTLPFLAPLLNLMTNQSYAQVTIACNTVESPVFTRKSPNKAFIFPNGTLDN